MYLLSQIWIYLALAGLIGFAAGWWWGRCGFGTDRIEAERDRARDMAASLEAENAWLKAIGPAPANAASVAALDKEILALKAELSRARAEPTLAARPTPTAPPATPVAPPPAPKSAPAKVSAAKSEPVMAPPPPKPLRPQSTPTPEGPSNAAFTPSPVAAMDPLALEAAVLAMGAGVKPQGLALPQGGKPDDLKEIGGVGPANEKWLHDQGFYHFWQIASLDVAGVAWLSQKLPTFGQRVYRENWVDQATRLARGELTDAKKKYEDGKQS